MVLDDRLIEVRKIEQRIIYKEHVWHILNQDLAWDHGRWKTCSNGHFQRSNGAVEALLSRVLAPIKYCRWNLATTLCSQKHS